MQFICVKAFLDVYYSFRDDTPYAEFSWQGYNERDETCGRGWVKLVSDNKLEGHFFIHNGEDSAFVCEKV